MPRGIPKSGINKGWIKKDSVPWNKGKKSLIRGNKHFQWKGGDASYRAFHIWLNNNYGKPDKCEHKECVYPKSIYRNKKRRGYRDNPEEGDRLYKILPAPNRYEWALLKNKKHSHDRDSYIMLCPHCHHKYDMGLLEINIKI